MKHLRLEDQSIKQLREYSRKLVIAIAKKIKVLDKIIVKVKGNVDSLFQLGRFDSSLLSLLADLNEDNLSANSKVYWFAIATYLRDKLKSLHINTSELRRSNRKCNKNASNPSSRINPLKSLGVGVTKSSNGKSRLPKHTDLDRESKKVSRTISRYHYSHKTIIKLTNCVGNTYIINLVNNENKLVKVGYLKLLKKGILSERIDNLPIEITWIHDILKANQHLYNTVQGIDNEVVKLYQRLIVKYYYPDRQPTREFNIKRDRSNKNNNVRVKIEVTRDRKTSPDIEHNTRLNNHSNIAKSDRRSLYLDRLAYNEVSDKKPLTIA